MKFCPNCEVRLKKSNTRYTLSCPKCDYSESDSKENKKDKKNDRSELNILDENEGKETLPSIKNRL
jgi:transcription factor S